MSFLTLSTQVPTQVILKIQNRNKRCNQLSFLTTVKANTNSMCHLLGIFLKYPACIPQKTSSNPAALKSRRRERKKTWGSRRSRRRRFPARFTTFLLTLRIAVRNFGAHQLCQYKLTPSTPHTRVGSPDTSVQSVHWWRAELPDCHRRSFWHNCQKDRLPLAPSVLVYYILQCSSRQHSTQFNCQTDFDGLKIGACKHTSTWIVPPMSTFSVNYKWCMTLATSVVRYHRRKIGNR